MGQKDNVTKMYMQNDRRFADAFNYFLYDGNPVIVPENLVEQDTTELLTFYGTDEKIVSKQNWRDVLKRAILKKDDKAYYLLLGIENQSEVHYAMPVRNMVYDALNYASQVSEAAKRHKENDEYGTSAEFLSGFHKDDRLTPVITLVIYWEDGAWDGPRSIHEMLNQTDPKLLKYVSDYKIHMIVPDEVEDFAKFQTELRTVLRFMSVKDEKEKLKSMVNTYRGEYSQVDAESAKVLNACAGVKLTHKVTEGGYDVCKGIEDMKKEELERGLAVGSAETLVQNVEALSQNMKLSVEAACAAVNASYETYLEAKALLAK